MSSERVLVWLKPKYLGDAVMATPLLDGLVGLGLKPSVLVGGAVRQVLADREEAVDFLPSENLSNPLGLLRQARLVRGYGTVLLVNRSFRSALAARLAGIPRRVGHATEGRGFLLTDSLSYSLEQFEAESYLDLARAAGYAVEGSRPRLSVTALELAAGRSHLGAATVGVQPGARYASKQIPIPVMAEVVRRLQGEGRTVAFLGGKEEAVAGEELRRLVGPQVVNLIGVTGLRETLGALANLELMVGSDTGVMHLAAAVGCPTVTVFGPNPIAKWGHDYAPHRALAAPGGEITRVGAEEILAAAEGALSGAVRP